MATFLYQIRNTIFLTYILFLFDTLLDAVFLSMRPQKFQIQRVHELRY